MRSECGFGRFRFVVAHLLFDVDNLKREREGEREREREREREEKEKVIDRKKQSDREKETK